MLLTYTTYQEKQQPKGGEPRNGLGMSCSKLSDLTTL